MVATAATAWRARSNGAAGAKLADDAVEKPRKLAAGVIPGRARRVGAPVDACPAAAGAESGAAFKPGSLLAQDRAGVCTSACNAAGSAFGRIHGGSIARAES